MTNITKPIRVLIVDDSALVRKVLSMAVQEDGDMEVVGTAVNGREGVEMAEELRPDVITLDIIMPEMSGLEALKLLKKKTSAKILMISSLSEEGAHATFEALSIGAEDFITKSFGDSAVDIVKFRKKVASRIKELFVLKKPEPATKIDHVPGKLLYKEVELVAIGTSTGGPAALQKLLPEFESNFPVGGLIVQHMPTAFIPPFAERMNQLSKVSVVVAEKGQKIEAGCFYLAPGDFHMKVKKGHATPAVIDLEPEPAGSLHRPSVDQMFLSVARAYPGNALGVVLTGMGQDGLLGAREMKKNNSPIFAQLKESCVVYGMPRAIVDENLADKILPLEEMKAQILKAVKH